MVGTNKYVFDTDHMERMRFDDWCRRYGIKDVNLAEKQKEEGWSLAEIKMGAKRQDRKSVV